MESIWSSTCRPKERAALNGDIQADAVVIGGEMAGILTAYSLQRAGVRTVVLEAERIGGGQTKNTTAKITSQHGMFCSSFIEKKGKDTAEKYVQANQQAVENTRRSYAGKKSTAIWKRRILLSILMTKKNLSWRQRRRKSLVFPCHLRGILRFPFPVRGL